MSPENTRRTSWKPQVRDYVACQGYITIKTKQAALLDITGFFFTMSANAEKECRFIQYATASFFISIIGIKIYPICGPPPFFFFFFNSSLLWDVFIINSVEQLQTWQKTQSEIGISPFLKTQKPSSTLLCVFVFLEMGLYRSWIEFLVMLEVVQHCL